MQTRKTALFVCGMTLLTTAWAQVATIDPQIRTRATAQENVTVVEVAAHFVTAIRLPEAVNSVVVGDPALFQVEHSEQEPALVFVKALTLGAAETNLLISTAKGRQVSMLLVSLEEEHRARKWTFCCSTNHPTVSSSNRRPFLSLWWDKRQPCQERRPELAAAHLRQNHRRASCQPQHARL